MPLNLGQCSFTIIEGFAIQNFSRNKLLLFLLFKVVHDLSKILIVAVFGIHILPNSVRHLSSSFEKISHFVSTRSTHYKAIQPIQLEISPRNITWT